jgi:8-oxo-dGTP diphosphatase
LFSVDLEPASTQWRETAPEFFFRGGLMSRDSSVPTPIAIAVVERAGEYLIGQRPEGVPLAGLWEFPGGKVKPGETPAEAAVRECQEETGLTVSIERLLMRVIHKYEHGTLEIHFVACSPRDDAVAARAPFRWVAVNQLAGYEFPAANRQLLELLARSRKSH